MLELKDSSKEYMNKLFSAFPMLKPLENNILQAIEVLLNSIRNNGTIFVCGNGGSASDAEHIVGELMKSFMKKRPMPLEMQELFKSKFEDRAEYLINTLEGTIRAVSLVSSVSLATALMNDTSADILFAQQVYGLARKGDVVWAISTSGTAKNVNHALAVAKALECKTIGLSGKTGGEMASLLDVEMRAPHNSTPIIQEMHLPIYHAICAILEEELF